MIIPNDLACLRSHYRIPDCVELLRPIEGETLRDHYEGCIFLNDWMFKAGVQIPFEFSISKLLLIFDKLQFFYVRFREAQEWNNELLQVQSVALEELELGQRAAPKFLQSYNLKWHSVKGSFSGGVRAFPFREFQPILLRKNQRAVYMERHRALLQALIHLSRDRRHQSSITLVIEHCRMSVRRRGSALLREARRSSLFVTSPKASMDPTSLGSTTPPIPGIKADTATAQVSLLECDADLGVVGVPVGLLLPFDKEARALMILGELLPVLLRGIRECHALGFTPSINKEGRGADERMLLEYLPDMWKELSERIHLIDRCASRVKYHYHVLGKSTDLPVERSHAQDRFGVLRPNAGIPSKCELREEVLAKACSLVRERLEEAERAVLELRLVLYATRAELEEARNHAKGVSLANVDASPRRLSYQANHAREEVSRLLFELNVVRAECDEAVGRAVAIKEEVLQFSIELVTIRSEVEDFRARGANPGEVWALQEWVVILSSRELKLLAESETVRAEVVRLPTELEMLRAERLQVASPQEVTFYPWDRFLLAPVLKSLRSNSIATSINDVRSSSILTIPEVGM
ncbi:hypothetical protein ACLOJK_014561 [Asimina triloba]